MGAYALIDEAFPAFRSDHLLVRPASSEWERQGYYSLRRSVFSDEQRLLAQDRDQHDFHAIPIVALACNCAMADRVVGAVRIYRSGPQQWHGGRLCVERAYRHHGMIGKALVNEAVARAIELGCTRFVATVQAANETYFQSLHWHTLEAIELHGQPHRLMQAQLDHYPFMPRQQPLPVARRRAHG